MSQSRRLQLWGAGTARTFRPLWMAEELGLDYELVPIGPRTGETRTPEFTALNPKQKIPLLIDGDLRLTESLAICRYLRDNYPGDNLWRPETPRERACEDEWCCYVYGELDETALYVIRRHEDLAAIYGEAPLAVSASREYAARHFAVIEAHLADRAWLVGAGFGLADLLLVTCLEWAAHCRLDLPPRLQEFRARAAGRPAFRRAWERSRASGASAAPVLPGNGGRP